MCHGVFIYDVRIILGILDPLPPLVPVPFTQLISAVITFWAIPLPFQVRTSFVNGPCRHETTSQGNSYGTTQTGWFHVNPSLFHVYRSYSPTSLRRNTPSSSDRPRGASITQIRCTRASPLDCIPSNLAHPATYYRYWY